MANKSKFLGFRNGVDEMPTLLEYDTASLGNCFTTFRDHYVVSKRLKTPNNVASYPRRTATSDKHTFFFK
jgi:hypothetical protein